MMPTMPTSTTHARLSSKRASTAELATRSPMSTKPPMAVRTPRRIDSSFFTTGSLVDLQERLELPLVVVEGLSGRREVVEASATDHDPDLGHVVDGRCEEVGELPAQGVGSGVRRLDRREGVLHRGQLVLLLRDEDGEVRTPGVAVRGRLRGE